MTGLWDELEAVLSAPVSELEADEVTALILVDRTGCSQLRAERLLKAAWEEGKLERRPVLIHGHRNWAYREKK